MLFSNAQIADLISREFEPAWQSVRPVAMIRVDFGNGKTITRTLNGNVGTYICTADGTVLDVIPGVYDPVAYRERLNQATLLHRWASRQPSLLKQFLQNYHREQAAALRQHNEPKVIVEVPDQPLSIVRVEAGMKLVLKSSRRGRAAGLIASATSATTDGRRGATAFAASDVPSAPRPVAGKNPPETVPVSTSYDLPADLHSRLGRVGPEMLADDTRHNESVRRLQVHDYLADRSPVQPAEMTRWLYREVLHTDLDDPYLGLGKLLFATYPFGEEDGRHE